jgi:hypothetical protein
VHPPVESIFRSRIQIGSSKLLQTYQTECPKCLDNFALLFPVSILHLPEHRVLEILCPNCNQEFTQIAADIVVAEPNLPTAKVMYIR